MTSSYKKLCTQYYDLESHKDHAEALAFYLAQAELAQGPILEPMCGTGRFLIPLLEAGYSIEGFDASADMLAALYQKYACISTKKPPVWQQCIHEFSTEKRYKLIFIPYGSWGLILEIRVVAKNDIKSLLYNIRIFFLN